MVSDTTYEESLVLDTTYEEALVLIDNLTDELGKLEPSVEGYVDLLKFAIEELQVCLNSARDDLDAD
jgi:hypothetical protein